MGDNVRDSRISLETSEIHDREFFLTNKGGETHKTFYPFCDYIPFVKGEAVGHLLG